MVGAAATMTALLACGVIVLSNLPGVREPSFKIDKALLRQTKARLTEIVTEFERLPLPEGVTGKGAKYFGCGTESGGLYQPFVFRELTTGPLAAVPAAAEVAQELRERGWTATPDGSRGHKLSADRDAWALTGWVAASPGSDVIWIQARIDGAQPCRLDSE